MDAVQIILILIVLIMMIIGIIKDLKSQKAPKRKKKKKGYDPKNNYFRNNPEHVDMTESYIDSIWEEMKKN